MLIVTPALLLLVIASLCDLRSREIPDLIPILLLAWALICRLAPLDDLSWADTALGLVAGFGLPAVLFHAGGLGGGDVKLLGALGALVGWPAAGLLLVATGIAGGVLALAVVFGKRRAGDDADDAATPSPAELPYALAIGAGFLAIWWRGDWPLLAEVVA